MLCTNCKRVSTKEQDFYDISLVVKGKKSILQSFEEFTRIEEMKDDNAYHCGNCASKQTAEKNVRFDKLPTILNLHLKRYKQAMASHNFFHL